MSDLSTSSNALLEYGINDRPSNIPLDATVLRNAAGLLPAGCKISWWVHLTYPTGSVHNYEYTTPEAALNHYKWASVRAVLEVRVVLAG